MSNASQNSAYFASCGGKRAGAFARLLRFLFLPILVLRIFLTLPSHAEEQFKTVRSHNGNFIVTALDASVAGWVGRVAELTRGRVFALLDCDREWRQAATIVIRERTQETEEGELRLCTISVAKGAFIAIAPDVYPNRRDDAVVLQVVKLCLADIRGIAPPQKESSPGAAVPPWLVCGVAENLSAGNLPAFREYAADIVSKETFFPLEQLFRTDVVPLDESQRELFFKESASVVDFLLHREDGKARLREAIARLGEEGDFTASLLFAFSRDFGELPQLQENWKRFAVRQAERTIGSSRMFLSETKKALDRVLIAEIPSVDRDSLEEKVITTDLPGLFRHRNRLVIQQIASQKASEVFTLSLRAMPQYSPILQEYLLAITAIAKDDRAGFRKHFASAERLRKKLEESPDFETEKDENADSPDK